MTKNKKNDNKRNRNDKIGGGNVRMGNGKKRYAIYEKQSHFMALNSETLLYANRPVRSGRGRRQFIPRGAGRFAPKPQTLRNRRNWLLWGEIATSSRNEKGGSGTLPHTGGRAGRRPATHGTRQTETSAVHGGGCRNRNGFNQQMDSRSSRE